MFYRPSRLIRKSLLPLLAAGLLAFGLMPGISHAGYIACGTDPLVTLSNGHQIRLWANISTDISNVSSVSYVLHIPTGLAVTNVQYDQYASIENFSWVADQARGMYESDTTAQLLPGLASTGASAWMSWDRGNNTYTTAGQTGQTLVVLFQS